MRQDATVLEFSPRQWSAIKLYLPERPSQTLETGWIERQKVIRVRNCVASRLRLFAPDRRGPNHAAEAALWPSVPYTDPLRRFFTVHRWRKEPAFQAEFNQRAAELEDAARTRLFRLAQLATVAVEKAIQAGDERVATAVLR